MELKVKQTSNVTNASTIIEKMLEENNQLAQRKVATLAEADNDSVSYDWVSTSTGTTDEIWYKGQLRVETTNSQYLDRDLFTQLVSNTLDTGYVKKKTKWWKKLIAIVVVIIAIYISAGAAASAVASGAASSFTAAFAFNLGIASLALTAIQYALSAAGQVGFAQYLGKVAQIVSYTSTLLGISAFLQNLGKNAFIESLKKGVGSVYDYAINVVDTAISELSTAVSKFIESASIGGALDIIGTKIVSIGMKVAQKVMSMRVTAMESDIRSLETQVQESQDALDDILDKEIHIGVEDIKYYTKPLDLNNIVFEVDYQYEGTHMNIGRPSFYPYGLNERDKQA